MEDLPNIIKYLRQHADAEAGISDDYVQIVCDLEVKKFGGRALRKHLRSRNCILSVSSLRDQDYL